MIWTPYHIRDVFLSQYNILYCTCQTLTVWHSMLFFYLNVSPICNSSMINHDQHHSNINCLTIKYCKYYASRCIIRMKMYVFLNGSQVMVIHYYLYLSTVTVMLLWAASLSFSLLTFKTLFDLPFAIYKCFFLFIFLCLFYPPSVFSPPSCTVSLSVSFCLQTLSSGYCFKCKNPSISNGVLFKMLSFK